MPGSTGRSDRTVSLSPLSLMAWRPPEVVISESKGMKMLLAVGFLASAAVNAWIHGPFRSDRQLEPAVLDGLEAAGGGHQRVEGDEDAVGRGVLGQRGGECLDPRAVQIGPSA